MCKLAYKELAIDLAMDLFQEGKEKGYTEEILAEKIGCSPYSILDYRYGRSAPSLAVFLGGFIAVKPVKTLKKLAKYSGCIVIQLPEVDKPFTTLLKETSQVMKETADVIDSISQAIQDNRITEAEKKQINKEIEEAIEELLKLKKVVEGLR